jgi:hypothetical protein
MGSNSTRPQYVVAGTGCYLLIHGTYARLLTRSTPDLALTVAWLVPLLQDYHSLCSFGRVTFLPGNNVVVGPFVIPWTGTGSAGAYNSNNCGGPEVWG